MIEIDKNKQPEYQNILTNEALDFLEKICNKFEDTRQQILENRKRIQDSISSGNRLSFPENKEIREKEWTVTPPPDDVANRNVEITGPVDRKMIINALNSGADVFMADFEDSTSPTWKNIMDGQVNLLDANLRDLEFVDPKNKKTYSLNAESKTSLFVRPRGLHLNEKNFLIEGNPISGAFLDFALYAFHNSKLRLDRGIGTYFYIPKLENSLESKLWDDIFTFSEDELDLPRGTIRATVLLETISASFEIEEILFSLKEHSLGMNAGRWDYIFSAIKKHREIPGINFPDRSQITMTVPFMKAYTELLVQSCHKRGAHAIGGMSAFIPNRRDPEVTEQAFDQVKRDKEREVNMGFDGSWVAHPDLVQLCKDVFQNSLNGKDNQIDYVPTEPIVSEDMLQDFTISDGTITEEGIRTNIRVGILYIQSWLLGQGAAALFNLMEDAATAEISRSQLWQWLNNKSSTNDKQKIEKEYIDVLITDEVEKIRKLQDETSKLDEATDLFKNLIFDSNFQEFLTLPAYNLID
tara:strand:+ start:1228 stop:2799 length:1572 start_codon:yes stop_codon:yes gene_type:complete